MQIPLFLAGAGASLTAAAVGSWGHGKQISGCPRAGQPQICLPWGTTTRLWWWKQVRKRKICTAQLNPSCQMKPQMIPWFWIFTSCSGLNMGFLSNHPCFCSPHLAICWGLPRTSKALRPGAQTIFDIHCPRVRLRCPAVAGREGMETQSSLWCIPHVICHSEDWVSICSLPRRQKERWGSFRWFQLRPCQGRLAQPVGRNRLVAAVVLHKGTSA